MFQFGEFIVGEAGNGPVGKPAEDEVHFPGAAMPAAKQKPLAALVEALARPCRSRHFRIPSNAKSPDVPGGADIASRMAVVSPSRSRLSTVAVI
jgi:hypothetical protein